MYTFNLDDDVLTPKQIWWNFSNYYHNNPDISAYAENKINVDKTMYGDGTFKIPNTLIFDNEADIMLFILKWS